MSAHAPDEAEGVDDGHGLRLRHGSVDATSSLDTRPSWSARSQDGGDVTDRSSASSLLDEAEGDAGPAPAAAPAQVLATERRPLVPGIYVPTLAFFDPDTEAVDVATTARHARRMAEAGVAGLATQGSNGEAVHLSHAERRAITRATRRALDEAGYGHVPVIAGCGAQSTRETVAACRDAARAGADYALVLPPSYYRALFTPGSILDFFRDVADQSPLPILIYNYPAATTGVDLDSDAIIRLSAHPNIVGCKLTCGNTGKLTRIAAAVAAAAAAAAAAHTPRPERTRVDPHADRRPHDAGRGRGDGDGGGAGPRPFMCLGGSADFILPMLVGGGAGAICGLANIAPKACVQTMRRYEAGQVADAQRLQAAVARGDWVAIQAGIVGAKAVLVDQLGYGGHGRKPLPRPSPSDTARYVAEWRELLALEQSL
ncbi:MAG: hypothetical protein M1826_003774 [Phylliscum demangeonii]|nr:MAG: hypothetical protein M1826_003774 [Phylliscum demangeonii]